MIAAGAALQQRRYYDRCLDDDVRWLIAVTAVVFGVACVIVDAAAGVCTAAVVVVDFIILILCCYHIHSSKYK